MYHPYESVHPNSSDFHLICIFDDLVHPKSPTFGQEQFELSLKSK